MSPRPLIEARQELGEANERLVLGCLASLESGLSPAELRERTGLPERTQRNAIDRLCEKGLAVRNGRRRILATSAGRSELGAGLPGVALGGALEAAIGHFPTEAQRAFARLLLSSVIARHHLRATLPDGWGSFVVVGPTKSGKTAIAHMVARLFGWSAPHIVRYAPQQTPGSIWGRRLAVPGGSYRFEPSPVLSQPFVCVDEFDKAEPEVARAVMRLAQGESQVVGELEELAEVAPTLLLCANGRATLVRAEYRRRAVVVDLGELEPLLADVPDRMRELLEDGQLPRLRLDDFAVPGFLGVTERAALRDALRRGLNEKGNRQVDERAVERMVLGRIALGCEASSAVLATAADYMTCATTVGECETIPADIAVALGARPIALAPDLAATARELVTPAARAKADRQVEIEVARARAELGERLTQAIGSLNLNKIPQGPLRVEANGIRAALRKCRDAAGKQVSADGVAEIESLARRDFRLAEELVARVAQERAEREGLDRAERDRRALAAGNERAMRRQRVEAAAAASAALDAVRANVRVLEGMYARKTTASRQRPDLELARFRLPGGASLLYVEALPQAPQALRPFVSRRSRRAASDRPPPATHVWSSSFDPSLRFGAYASGCPALSKWGAHTRQVLAPAIRMLHQREDQLCLQAGRSARRRRPMMP